MRENGKEDVKPNVLSDALLAEYVLKNEENARFKLDEDWGKSETFDDFVKLYKLALVIIALLNAEQENENFLNVRLCFEKHIFREGNIEKLGFYYDVKAAMDKLGELIDSHNYPIDTLVEQNKKLSWIMTCLRDARVIEANQALIPNSSVIWMGWAMAWLREAMILETNPAKLVQFAMMWVDNYIRVTNILKKFNQQ